MMTNMSLLTSAISSCLPHYDLAHRYASFEVSWAEDAGVRLKHAAYALIEMAKLVGAIALGILWDASTAMLLSIHPERFATGYGIYLTLNYAWHTPIVGGLGHNAYWVWNPQDAAHLAYINERYDLCIKIRDLMGSIALVSLLSSAVTTSVAGIAGNLYRASFLRA